MLAEEVRVRERFKDVRETTESITSLLSVEDHVVQPIVDVSPPKWHLGHTTWFFETFILAKFKKNFKVYDESFGFIFNSYYESVGKRLIRANRGNLTRPTVDEVMAYRKYVNEEMYGFLEHDQPTEVMTLLELGLQHEQQHQELLFYDIKYILGNNPLFPVYSELKSNSGEAKKTAWLNVQEGAYWVGFDEEGFCFDNELGNHKVYLHDYAIADRLITNKEYLEFVLDGGYTNFRHWLSEGWDWVNQNKIIAPANWYKKDRQWFYYSLNGGLKPLDMDAPVTHISYYEADAYAKWRDMRLPTEFEWEVACKTYGEITSDSNFMDNGNFEPIAHRNGNNQFYGDVWEWTSSAYLPYPFYTPPAGAVGEYNGKFMVSQMVLRGGSCATPSNHIRNTYRNFFHPHLRWMFSGIRLAKHI